MKSRTKSGLKAIGDAQFQVSLPMQGVLHDAQDAFVGLCVEVGKQVLAAMMEADRAALCEPRGVPDARRRAVRGGSTRSQVVLGGQRIEIRRPRARALDAGELALPSFTWATGIDPLNAATMAAIAAGVSTRRYCRTVEQLAPHTASSATSTVIAARSSAALGRTSYSGCTAIRRPIALRIAARLRNSGFPRCDRVRYSVVALRSAASAMPPTPPKASAIRRSASMTSSCSPSSNTALRYSAANLGSRRKLPMVAFS